MSAKLTYDDFSILLALESDPFMPMTELATKLGVTRITAKKRVDTLKERGVIRPPIAIYNPRPLNLYRVNIFAQVSSMPNLMALEIACDEHPYTHYRVRCFGGGFGLFMQFDIPPNSLGLLTEFFDELEKVAIIENYEVFVSTGLRANAFADLSRFNSTTSKWNFSWKAWFDSLAQYKSQLPIVSRPKVDYSTFHPRHFKILRLLTANGSLKQADIKDKLNLSRTQAHREYNYVKDNYIEQIRFMYNREIFALTEIYIAFGYNIKNETAAKFYHAIKNDPPPFRSALDVSEGKKITLWANMTSAQAASFAFSVWQQLGTIKIYTLDTKRSEMYWFYPDNFDFENQCWKVSKSYIVTDPLQRTLTNQPSLPSN